MQAEESRKSECLAVMVKIGVQTLPYRESGQTSVWSFIVRIRVKQPEENGKR
jgi:hypothetical protein